MPERFPGSEGEDFLKEKYSDLANSAEIESAVNREELLLGEERATKKEEKIRAYLDRLSEIFEIENEGKKERVVNVLKDKLHEKLVIKEGDIPESYFKNQQRIAREQGHGDVEITDNIRHQSAEIIIKDQEQSLDNWVDYLGSPDAMYPDWLKYWALRSVANLAQGEKDEQGKANFAKREFAKYDKNEKLKNSPTVKPFPDINREALAYVLDAVRKRQQQKVEIGQEMQKIKASLPSDVALDKKQEREIENRVLWEKNAGWPTDEQWEKLLGSQNFGDLYAHAIEKVTPASEEEKENIQGEWIKYEKGSDAKLLYESLQGHGTGWCTAGESVAKSQLEVGDFYVFYSKDKQGVNKIPRVAIRMQGGEIAEVRGIESDQNLEPVMVDIAKEKYNTLPGGEKYEKRCSDMKKLTEIEKKFIDTKELEKELNELNQVKPAFAMQDKIIELQGKLEEIKSKNQEVQLTKKELEFLYEVDSKIEGFGYRKDPRISEIMSQRDSDKDVSLIFECQPEQVVHTLSDVNPDTKVCVSKEYGLEGCVQRTQDVKQLKVMAEKQKILKTTWKAIWEIRKLTDIEDTSFQNSPEATEEKAFQILENEDKLPALYDIANQNKLTPEELKLLYEVDRPLSNLGDEYQSVVESVKSEQHLRSAYATIYGCKLEEVAWGTRKPLNSSHPEHDKEYNSENLNDQTVVYIGDLDFSQIYHMYDFPDNLKYVIGNLNLIKEYSPIKDIKHLEYVRGNVYAGKDSILDFKDVKIDGELDKSDYGWKMHQEYGRRRRQ